MSGDALAYLLYGVFGLGALAVYFALPQEGRWPRQTAPVLGLSALVGLLILLGLQFVPESEHGGYFTLFAAIAIYGAARVITHARPVYSAVYFVLVVIAVAGMMVLLSAEFLAVAMIVIYAGAILVTYVFVMMLAHHGARADYDRNSRAPLGAVLAGFVLTATIAGAIGSRPAVPVPPRIDAVVASSADVVELPPGNTAAIGASILGPYIVPLEVAGVLLLVAMVGALAVARKKVPVDMTALSPDADRPLGQSGREAPPFSPELKEVT